jgi:3-phenylpropionate/trans-cinnamate dioxygenase ferredoxin component
MSWSQSHRRDKAISTWPATTPCSCAIIKENPKEDTYYFEGYRRSTMEYVKVASTAELPLNTMKMVVVAGKEVLLANVEGSYHAIANKCTHLGGSLANGSLQGGIVTCPRHGARFDVKTGKAVGDARITFVKMKVKDEISYPVKVEGTDILVGIP